MRATCEIIADLKDNKEVPYEELKKACLVQSSIIFFYQQDTKALLQGGGTVGRLDKACKIF